MRETSANIIETFISTSRYLDQIYPTELQINKAISFNTEPPSPVWTKLDDFNFEIVNFLFIGGDVFRSPPLHMVRSLFGLREHVLIIVTPTIEIISKFCYRH